MISASLSGVVEVIIERIEHTECYEDVEESHKELWFYLMYHTETTVRMIDGIAGTTPLAVLALITT